MTVSGDFYDFILLDDNRLGIAIADVRGKGIPAALLMVMIRTILRLICREETSPAAALKRINDLLAIDTDPDLFATMVYGILDSAARDLYLFKRGAQLSVESEKWRNRSGTTRGRRDDIRNL